MLASGEGTTCNLAEHFVENGAEILCYDSHKMQPIDIWRVSWNIAVLSVYNLLDGSNNLRINLINLGVARLPTRTNI